jgi:hypothetical protein
MRQFKNKFESTRNPSHESIQNPGLDFLKDIQHILTGQEQKNRVNNSNSASAMQAQLKRTGAMPPKEKIEVKFRRGNHQPHYSMLYSEKENTAVSF